MRSAWRGDPRLRPRPRQPDRRAHRLQRRARAAVRDRPRRDGRGRAAAPAARSAPRRATSARPTRSRPPRPSRADGWRAFVRGTVAELRAAGVDVPGARLAFSGDVPQGSGPVLLGGARGRAVPRAARARRRRASPTASSWRGSARGSRTTGSARRPGCSTSSPRCAARAGRALRIDFATLDLRPVPLELGDWRLVTLDSGAEHSHAAGGYNERRARVPRGVRRARRRAPQRRRSRGGRARLPGAARPPRAPRARPRTRASTRWSPRCAPATCRRPARLLDASHASLRDDYDASVPAVEATRRARSRRAGAAGARMVGGGFGGSVLALLAPGADRRRGQSRSRRGRRRVVADRARRAARAGRRVGRPRAARRRRSPRRAARERPAQEERRGDQHRRRRPTG